MFSMVFFNLTSCSSQDARWPLSLFEQPSELATFVVFRAVDLIRFLSAKEFGAKTRWIGFLRVVTALSFVERIKSSRGKSGKCCSNGPMGSQDLDDLAIDIIGIIIDEPIKR